MDVTLMVFVRVVFVLFIFCIFVSYLKFVGCSFNLSYFFSTFLGLVTLSIIVVHGVIPIIQDVNPNFYRLKYANDYTFTSKATSSIYVLFFYMFFIFFYFVVKCFKSGKRFVSVDIKFNKKVKFVQYLTLYFPAFISILFVVNKLAGVNVAEFLVDRISLFRGLGAVLLLTNLLTFIATIYFYRYYKWNEKSCLYKYFLLVLLMLLTFTLIGSRNSFFIFLIFNLSIFFHLGGRLSLVKFSMYCTSALLFFAIIGFYRVRLDSAVDVGVLSSDLISGVLGSVISVFGTDEILLYLIHIDFHDFENGKTFIAAITNFVPRGLWPDKPLGAGPLITNLINPGAYGLELSNISSYTTGLVAESYINYGFVGVFIIPFFLVLAFVIIENLNVSSFYSLMIKTYLSIMFGFAIFYSEFLGVFARALYVVIPLVLCLFIYNLISVKKEYRVET